MTQQKTEAQLNRGDSQYKFLSCIEDNDEDLQMSQDWKFTYYLRMKENLYIDLVQDINDTEAFPRPVFVRNLSKNLVTCNLCGMSQTMHGFKDVKVIRIIPICSNM